MHYKLFQNNISKYWWYLLFAMLILVNCFGLGLDVGGDAGLYAAISKQMFSSGEFINIKFNGVAYDQKPPLLFWLSAFSFKIFGVSNFAFKFPILLYACLGVWAVFLLARAVFNKEVAILSALFLGSTQVYFLYVMDVHMDMILQTNTTFSLYFLWKHLNGKQRIEWNFVLAFVFVGLSILTKGPIGIVVPALATIAFLISKRRYKQLINPKWFLAVLITFLVASPALIGLYNQLGIDGLKFFFITNNFGRITGSYEGSNNDVLYYFHNLLWLVFPWSVFLIIGIIKFFREKEHKQFKWFFAGAIIPYFLVLSIAKGKAPNYVFMILPLLIIVLAWQYYKLHENQLHVKRLNQVQWIIITMGWGVLIFIFVFFGSLNISLVIVCLIALLWSVYLFLKNRAKSEVLLFISILFIVSFNLVLNAGLISELARYQGPKQVIEIFEANKNENSKLCNYHCQEYEIFFYADPVQMTGSYETYKKMLQRSDSWIYTIKNGLDDIMSVDFCEVDTVYTIKKKGINKLSWGFINPLSRLENLDTTYLIKTK